MLNVAFPAGVEHGDGGLNRNRGLVRRVCDETHRDIVRDVRLRHVLEEVGSRTTPIIYDSRHVDQKGIATATQLKVELRRDGRRTRQYTC